MKIKVNQATGPVLDWMVELAKGTHWSGNGYFVFNNPDGTNRSFDKYPEWRYSTDWSQGGPIMDAAEIDTYLIERGSPMGWIAEITGTKYKGRGATRLSAAMRCYVVSKLGDEVEVPEELCS